MKQINEIDENQLSNDELAYLEFITFSRIKEVLPYEIKQHLLMTNYPTLDQVLIDLRYCKVWDFRPIKRDLFQNWPIDVYSIYRMEFGRGGFETYVFYDTNSNAYRLAAVDGFSEDQFNNFADFEVDSPKKALDYAVNVVMLLSHNGAVIEKELLYPSWDQPLVIKQHIEEISLPKISFQTDAYYVAEMYFFNGFDVPDLSCMIYKITIIISKQGKVAILKEEL